jgi:hypothetical protein
VKGLWTGRVKLEVAGRSGRCLHLVRQRDGRLEFQIGTPSRTGEPGWFTWESVQIRQDQIQRLRAFLEGAS